MKNLEYCIYTYKHRNAMKYLFNKYIKFNPELTDDLKNALYQRILEHDIDKMFLYLTLDKEKASKIHRNTASHHMENNLSKNELDYFEAILDYESAGYTKPDKPLNAYDTIKKLKNQLSEEKYRNLKRMLKKLNIYKSYSVREDIYGISLLNDMNKNITETDVKNEIKLYIDNIC